MRRDVDVNCLKPTLTTSLAQATRATVLVPYRKLILIISSVLLVLATLFAHLRIANNENYVGPLALLDRGFDFVLVCAIASVTFCIGRRLSRVLNLNFLSAAEEISFSLMLGTGATGILILVCGLAGFLTPMPVAGLLLALFAFSGSEIPRLYYGLRQGLHVAIATRGRMAYILVLIIGLVLLVVIEAIAPPWTHDELIYHLPATKAFVDHGRIYPLFDNSLGNMPFLIHMIYALCLMAKSDIAVRLFSLVLTLTTALSLYGFCARFLDRTTGLFAMVAFLAGAMVVEVAVTARVDVSLACMLFLTTYALIVYLDRGERGWLYAAGLLGGFSVGIKLTALAWLALLGIMFFFERFFRKCENRKAAIKDILILISIIGITASPWFIKNFIWFHNPVYPFQTGEVAQFESGTIRYFDDADERQLDAHFATVKREAPEQVKRFEKKLADDAAQRPPRHPLRFWESYTNPSAYFLGDYRHYPNYAFLLVPLYLLLPKRKWLSWLLGLSIVFYLLIASTSWIARFLLPIYPPLALIAAYTLAGLTKKLSSHTPLAAGLPLYVLAGCVGVPLAVSADNVAMMKNVSFVIGNRSRSKFLSEMDYYPAIQFINGELPPGSRVMLVGLQMGYHIKHEYLADESWDSTEWRRVLARNTSMAEINNDLKRHGITHILFSPSLFRFAALTGRQGSGGVEFMSEGKGPPSTEGAGPMPDYLALRNWATFDFYGKKFLEPVYSDENGHIIYRIR